MSSTRQGDRRIGLTLMFVVLLTVLAFVSIVSVKSSTIQVSSEEWALTISTTNQLEPVTFGINPNATDGYDPDYDVFAQMPIQDKVTLILDSIYAKEINRERMNWNLSVGVPTGEATTMSWEPSTIPATIVLTLDGTDMKVQNSLQLAEGSHSFIISGSSVESEEIFDTPANPYPSISGTSNGTTTPTPVPSQYFNSPEVPILTPFNYYSSTLTPTPALSPADSDGDGCSDEQEQPAPTPVSVAQRPLIPGFEAIFASISLLALVYVLRRTNRRV